VRHLGTGTRAELEFGPEAVLSGRAVQGVATKGEQVAIGRDGDADRFVVAFLTRLGGVFLADLLGVIARTLAVFAQTRLEITRLKAVAVQAVVAVLVARAGNLPLADTIHAGLALGAILVDQAVDTLTRGRVAELLTAIDRLVGAQPGLDVASVGRAEVVVVAILVELANYAAHTGVADLTLGAIVVGETLDAGVRFLIAQQTLFAGVHACQAQALHAGLGTVAEQGVVAISVGKALDALASGGIADVVAAVDILVQAQAGFGVTTVVRAEVTVVAIFVTEARRDALAGGRIADLTLYFALEGRELAVAILVADICGAQIVVIAGRLLIARDQTDGFTVYVKAFQSLGAARKVRVVTGQGYLRETKGPRQPQQRHQAEQRADPGHA